MSDSPAATDIDSRARLRGLARQLEHLLPAQAPIRDFVHHNTLHGFQHLPFAEAIAAARQLTGAGGWLPESLCRTLHRAGRISDDDLHHALDALPAQAPAEDAAFREIDLIALRHGATPLSPPQLTWEIAENAGLERFQADVAAEARARLLAGAGDAAAPATAIAELWQACREMLADNGDAPAATVDLGSAGEARLDALWQNVGVGATWRELLLALTGEDLMDELRPLLVRTLAAHLDLGLAAWPAPQRQRGLFAAWRAEAGADPRRTLIEGTELRGLAAGLPDDGLDALLVLLPQTGLAEAQWPGYLTRLALELPGWAGMVLWRAQRPAYADAPAVPVDILDYLAIHLAGELIAARRIVQRIWGLTARFDLLRWYFRHHPAEAIVRLARHAGHSRDRAGGPRPLPEALNDAAQQLIVVGRLAAEADAPEWQELATEILRLEQPAAAHDGQRVWPLFRLAQHLGLAAPALRAVGRNGARAMLARLDRLDEDRRGELWLLAYERHYRQQILAALHANHGRRRDVGDPAPTAQLVFCMDDREEGFRRHLEEVAPAVETFGAAGFFGIAMAWSGLDDDRSSALCPVVVTPAHAVHEVAVAGRESDLERRRSRRRLRRYAKTLLFQRSRLGVLAATAISSLAAPVALLTLLGKLVAPAGVGALSRRLAARFDHPVASRAAFTAAADAPPPEPARPRHGFTDAEQAERLAASLRTLGLVDRFAPLVVIVGHGSHSLNNPHRSAYDCGACSGRHGGPNARVFAAMANRPEIRARLAAAGIAIPATTHFLGAEHDTGDDTLSWFDTDLLPAELRPRLAELQRDLELAGARHAGERCRRFASAPPDIDSETARRHVAGRCDDFAQARPELGHVTNACAIIGRRALSRGTFLDRRAFLISYDPSLDADGRILEAILLAAGPVGAGISLEYYFSTVNNARYGCGSKVMHNLAGLCGVIEGGSSDLRTGLPPQMIEIHEAMRLLIVCEATPAMLSAILARQPGLDELVGKGWVQLVAQVPVAAGEAAQLHVFTPGGGWQAWQAPADAAPARAGSSTDWFAGQREALPPALIGTET